MWIQDILSTKTEARDTIKSTFNLPRRSKILIGVKLDTQNITENIVEWLSILPANFIIFWWEEKSEEQKNIRFIKSDEWFDMASLDAIVCDCANTKLEQLMEVWVVPIVNEKNYLWKILSEFHPGRAEWNAYLYEPSSYWSVYYALVRYLENHKFPYDNRNLVKNVSWV